MKEAFIYPDTTVEVRDSPTPEPGPDHVVIKVVVSGSNPKDWKYPSNPNKPTNQGDDIAGIIHSVGSNVVEFHPGDRVAAFHEMRTSGGSYAEYAVAWSHTTFHISKKTSFEEAATIPLAAMTSAVALYQRLDLPLPWHPASRPIPLIIYGAATAIGSFAIQLAVQSNIHPLICVAGRGIPHVESLIDAKKGDVVLDYRDGHEALLKKLEKARETAGGKIEHAYDCVSEQGSFQTICKVLDPNGGKITNILPTADYSEIPDSFNKSITYVGSVFNDKEWQDKAGTAAGNEDFANALYRYIARALQKGFFKGHPYEVVPGGLDGVQTGLTNLKAGKASALKYVFRISETKGAEQSHANL